MLDDKNALKRNKAKLVGAEQVKDYYYYFLCSVYASPIGWHMSKDQKVAGDPCRWWGMNFPTGKTTRRNVLWEEHA